MVYALVDFQVFLKDLVMQIGSRIQMRRNPLLDMFSSLVEVQFLGSLPRKLALLGLLWRLSGLETS